MTKFIVSAFLFVVSFSACAQTEEQLVGKWKLVKQTKNGKDKQIDKETYQVFKEDGVYVGIAGSKSREGKWKLSSDGKNLTIKISIVRVVFEVEYFDRHRRVISSSETGTLEYEKVED